MGMHNERMRDREKLTAAAEMQAAVLALIKLVVADLKLYLNENELTNPTEVGAVIISACSWQQYLPAWCKFDGQKTAVNLREWLQLPPQSSLDSAESGQVSREAYLMYFIFLNVLNALTGYPQTTIDHSFFLEVKGSLESGQYKKFLLPRDQRSKAKIAAVHTASVIPTQDCLQLYDMQQSWQLWFDTAVKEAIKQLGFWDGKHRQYPTHFTLQPLQKELVCFTIARIIHIQGLQERVQATAATLYNEQREKQHREGLSVIEYLRYARERVDDALDVFIATVARRLINLINGQWREHHDHSGRTVSNRDAHQVTMDERFNRLKIWMKRHFQLSDQDIQSILKSAQAS